MLRMLLSDEVWLGGIIIYIISSLAVIFLTLPIHEYAHGLAAVKLGDDTPRMQGRLRLDPFAHIDWMGALWILLFGFGWAKPVQVNHFNFRNPKRDMALTALAGPVANLIMAFVSLLLANLVSLVYMYTEFSVLVYLLLFFCFIASINIGLAVFNLIPIPPLDGSRILTAILPNKYYYTIMRYERYIFLALLAMIWFGVLDAPLNFLVNAVTSLYNSVFGLIFPNSSELVEFMMLLV